MIGIGLRLRTRPASVRVLPEKGLDPRGEGQAPCPGGYPEGDGGGQRQVMRLPEEEGTESEPGTPQRRDLDSTAGDALPKRPGAALDGCESHKRFDCPLRQVRLGCIGFDDWHGHGIDTSRTLDLVGRQGFEPRTKGL